MASETTPKTRIDNFLAQRRLAMVGASRNPRDFSRVLLREFLRLGYDVVPVNPDCPEMEGRACAASISAVSPAVGGVLFMTRPAVTEALVRDCTAAGIRHVWMYRAAGAGAVSERAVAFCNSHGIEVVSGECPFMFLTGAPWYHRLHGLVRRIQGTYPQ